MATSNYGDPSWVAERSFGENVAFGVKRFPGRWSYKFSDRTFTCMDCGFTLSYEDMSDRSEHTGAELLAAHQLLHKLNS